MGRGAGSSCSPERQGHGAGDDECEGDGVGGAKSMREAGADDEHALGTARAWVGRELAELRRSAEAAIHPDGALLRRTILGERDPEPIATARHGRPHPERVPLDAGHADERPGSGGWLPFGFGCVAGVVPWVAITIYLLSPGSTSSASPPGFVYGIFVSLFVFFNIFALNQWLQYRARGRWQDYLFGEKVYIVLSLTAKSALAWQIFAGTLAA